MKTTNILEEVKRKYSHRITKQEIIDGNRELYQGLALDDHDIQAMAYAVGLELEDLLLINRSVTVISRPAPAKHGRPGRKIKNFDIASFARDRRVQEPQMTWDEIYRDWIRTYPDDDRVHDKESVREPYRRIFGDKSKARTRVSKKP